MTKNNTAIVTHKSAKMRTESAPALPTTELTTTVPVPTEKLKYCEDTVKICVTVLRHLGSEMAMRQHLKIHPSTMCSWKKRHPEFADALMCAREDHLKYTLRNMTDTKLEAAKVWESYLRPQKRETITEVKTRAVDDNGDPLTVTRPIMKDGKQVVIDDVPQTEELGVWDIKTTKRIHWVEANLKVLQSFIATDNMDTFVLENLGKDYIDSAEDIIVQLLGKFVDLEEIKSVPQLLQHLLAPEIDILMLRKLQVINEAQLQAGHITHKQHNETAIATTKAAIDSNIKLEMKRKAPFGNKSYSEAAADYRNLTLSVVNIFREVLNAEPIDIETEAIIEKVYSEIRDRDAAGSIAGAVHRGEPAADTGSSSSSSRSKDGQS